MSRPDEDVLSLVRNIPKGRVTTYKEVAGFLNIGSPRAVGQILKRNPNPIQNPCHRVVMSDGSVGGYFGKNTREKIMLLESEGLRIEGGKIMDFRNVLFRFC